MNRPKYIEWPPVDMEMLDLISGQESQYNGPGDKLPDGRCEEGFDFFGPLIEHSKQIDEGKL